MGIETKQLRLSVALIDPASEQIKKLRGEMENLTGGAVSLGMGKMGQQSEGLAKQFVPLVSGLGQGTSIVQTVTDMVPVLVRSLGAAGAVVTAAVLNVDRYRKSLADYGSQARELNIAAASLKKVEQEWKRAGMTEPQREANRSVIAQAMGEAQNQASQLTRSLQGVMQTGGEGQRNAVANLMEVMRAGDYEGTANAIKEAGDAVYEDTLKLTNNLMRANESRNTFYRIIGVDGFTLPMQKIAKATRQEIDDMDRQIKQWGAFAAEVRRASVAIEKINFQIGMMTANYEPAIATWKTLLDAAKQTTSGLKRGREFRERMESAPTARDRAREKRELRERERPRKQSYSGGGAFGGAPIVLASYQDSTETIRDDVRETVILTEQFRQLNNLLRGAGGGGAKAIRASLGMPSDGGYGGGGGSGYGPSGTGTRGTGGGTTGPSTTQPSTPPGIPGMPGVQPGDVGVAAMVRAGMPRTSLLTSLQPTTPGGARPLAAPSMVGGAEGGVAGMIGAGVVGGTGGSVPAGAGLRTDVPGLKMPELPRGVPYGSASPAEAGRVGVVGTGVVKGRGTASALSEPAMSPEEYLQTAEARATSGVIARTAAGQPMPIGVRVNNPGNIKYTGSDWQRKNLADISEGHTKDQGDPQTRFGSPQAGMNAMARLLLAKTQDGKGTIRNIVSGSGGWTPTGFPDAYSHVAKNAGLDPDKEYDFTDPANLSKLMMGLQLQEQGKIFYPESMARKAAEKTIPAYRKHAGLSPGDTAPNVAPAPAVPTGAAPTGTGVPLPPRGALKTAEQQRRPPFMTGQVSMVSPGATEATQYRYGSGQEGRYQSIPYGTFQATPGTEGNIMRAPDPTGVNVPGYGRLGAQRGFSIEGGEIWDPKLGRMRGGISIHAGRGRLSTQGCIGISPEQWKRFKPLFLEKEKLEGKLSVSVLPNGRIFVYSQSDINEGRVPKDVANASRTSVAASGDRPPVPDKPLDKDTFSFKDVIKKKPIIDLSKLDGAMGKEVSSKVDGSGKIEVDVKGPSGTKVSAEGGGIFKKTEVNRLKEPIADKKEEPAKTEPKGERTMSRTDEE